MLSTGFYVTLAAATAAWGLAFIPPKFAGTRLHICALQATKVNAGPGMAVVVIVCSLLQAGAAWLAPNVYRRFGWHMYSKMACDLRFKDAEQCRKALCQLNRFGAMARLDGQVCADGCYTTT